jgi:hypothetical protein
MITKVGYTTATAAVSFTVDLFRLPESSDSDEHDEHVKEALDLLAIQLRTLANRYLDGIHIRDMDLNERSVEWNEHRDFSV